MLRLHTLCLVVMVAASTVCQAQNYQPYGHNRQYFFDKGYDGLTIMQATAVNYLPAYTEYVFPLRVPEPSWGNAIVCLPEDTRSYWFGSKMQRWHTGEFFMFLHDGDTVRLLPSAGLGESWQMWPLSAPPQPLDVVSQTDWEPRYLYATVVAHEQQWLPGGLDSVKVIEIEYRDTLGNVHDHAWNGQQFSLSKNHGFVESAMWERFPQGNPSRTYKQVREIDLSRDAFFDFRVGSKWHHQIERKDFGWPSYYEYATWEVLGVETNGNSRTVQFLHNQYDKERALYATENYSVTYNNLDEPLVPVFPGQVFDLQGLVCYPKLFADLMINGQSTGLAYWALPTYFFERADTNCIGLGSLDGYRKTELLVEGTGTVLSEGDGSSFGANIWNIHTRVSSDYLGTEIGAFFEPWPVAISGAQGAATVLDARLVGSWLELAAGDARQEVGIYNAVGQQMWRGTMQGTTRLHVGNWHTGIYFVRPEKGTASKLLLR